MMIDCLCACIRPSLSSYLKVLEHVARVNGKLDILGLDFSGQEVGEGDTLRPEGSGVPAYGPAGGVCSLVVPFEGERERERLCQSVTSRTKGRMGGSVDDEKACAKGGQVWERRRGGK